MTSPARSQRLPLAISVAALCVALVGVTPAEAVRVVKRALSAKNSDAVNHIGASRVPKAGQLLPLGSDGRFPVQVLPATARGPRGVEGPQGVAGPQGIKGSFSGIVVRRGPGVAVPNEGPVARDDIAMCSSGEHAVGGGPDILDGTGGVNKSGLYWTYGRSSYPLEADGTSAETDDVPVGWLVGATNSSGTTSAGGSPSRLVAVVLCAK
jgi:hypothetical protein